MTVRLTTTYRRSPWWWMSVLCGALAVVAALAVLKVGAAAPASVQISPSARGTDTARSYDIVVTAAGHGGPGDTGGWTANPAELDSLAGGITVGQYAKIRQLPGVDVAAPLTMVGYIPFTISAPVAIPASVRSAKPRGVTITVRLRSDNGLSTVTWDNVTIAYPDLRPSTLSVRLSWTFQLPLVAVDPAAEARLLHLDTSVTSGSYLPEAATPPSRPVPMLIAGSLASNEAADVTIDPQSSGTAGSTAGGITGGTATLTTATAYQALVGDARSEPGTITGYWTAGPVSYGLAKDGQLAPRQVATELAAAWDGPYMWAGAPAQAGVLDVPFRSLTQHAALAGGAKAQAVGVFDPAQVASEPATPSPYQPELLTGADVRSRQLLGGRPLAADGDPGAYPGSAASLVMPLADIGAFTSGYSGVDGTAPIGLIRVRVAGAADGSAASQERVQHVAQEIVRATGLHVQAVLGTTPTTRVVSLPAGLHGRPALLVDEVWYRSDVSTTVWAGLGPDSIALTELELLAGELVIVWGTWRLIRSRRGDLATLRALGWRRRQLGRQLLAEFALTAVLGVTAAVLAGYAIGSLLAGRPDWAWLLLSVPVALAVLGIETRRSPRWARMAAMVAALRVKLRATWPAAGRLRGPARLAATASAHPVSRLLRTPGRTVLAAFVIAVACLALSLELTVRWALSGAVTPWADRSVGWQPAVVDVAAFLLVAAMATFTVADLDLLTLRERAAEVRTLRAIGWRASDLTRRLLGNSVWPGLVGGVTAGLLDLLVSFAVTGAAVPRMLAITGLSVLFGVALSVLAAGLSAMISRSRGNPLWVSRQARNDRCLNHE
jgi:hypothetical protein